MTASHPFLIVLVALAFSLTSCLAAQAEIPKKSQEKLAAEASHQLSGTIIRTYEQKEKRGGFEYTHGVAEVSVQAVGKGADIEKGDRIFVRYWKKRWTKNGNPPPDHYGHWNIPKESDQAEIYVKGDRKNGFDVLSPNGFFELK